MAGEDDLVSKVSVEGTEAAAAKLNQYADQGAAAFDKLDKSAKGSSESIRRSNQTIENSNQQAARSFAQMAAVRINQAIAPDLAKIEQGTKQLVAVTRSAIPALASFVTRLTGLGTAAAAAGVGLLAAARSVANASKTQESATDKATAAQIDANNASLQGQVAAINLESSQRKLFQQLQSGQITYSEYSKSLQQLNADYKEQQKVAAQVEAAQESVRLENERLQKQAADTKAFQSQIDIFGGPLLSSLIQLGNQANALFNQFKNTFGPVIATGIDLISKALSTNGQAISQFFDQASAKMAAFLSENGPAIQKAFENIGTAIKFVFDGVISALPGLLEFFNNSLVPAVKAFSAVLDTAAKAINGIFGTNLTGGALVFIIILGQMTGAFVALINVVRIFAALGTIIAGLPFGAVFLAIAAAITVLLVLFPQLRQVASDVLNSILQAFQGMANGAVAAGDAVRNAWSGLVAFFTDIFVGIGAVFTGAWTLIVAGVTTAVQTVQDTWNTIVQFFSDITTQIGQFFTDLWNSVVNAFNTAVSTLSNAFTTLWNEAKAKLQPILDLLKAIAALASSIGGGGTQSPVTAAGGGHIRGPGTSTSDSIPAWLSDGEYVIKAKSVAKYGAGLLHAINTGRFRMPKFNMGGLVSGLMAPSVPRLAYADGGQVHNPSSMRPLNLNLFGEQFNGLLAPDDVGERLGKFAVSRQTRSAGRKPAWVGRGRN